MKKKTVKLRYRWMGAYSIVVLIMCLIFLFGMMLMRRSIESHDIEINQTSAEFVCSSLDEQWLRIFNYAFQIINDSRVQTLDGKAVLTEDAESSAYAVSTNIINNIMSNDLLEDVYLYFPSSDLIIGKKGVYGAGVYWASLYKVDQSYSRTAWMQQLFGARQNGYFLAESRDGLDLYYRMAIQKRTGRMLVAKINRAELERTLGWIGQDNGSCFMAMASDTGSCYAAYGNRSEFTDSETGLIRLPDKGRYWYTKCASSVGFFSYITIKEKSAAYRLSSKFTFVAVVCVIVALFGGVLLSAHFVQKTTRPIEQLASRLTQEGGGGQNELLTIESEVDRLLLENKRALGALTKQQERMVCRSFLDECLKISDAGGANVETLAAIYGLSFEGDTFTLILRERAGDDYSNRVIEFLDRCTRADVWVGWTQKQDLDVFVLNYDQEQPGVVDAFVNALRAISNAQSKVVIGEQTENPEEIRMRFIDCLQKLGRGEFFWFDENGLKFERAKEKMLLGAFLKSLDDGNFDNAHRLTAELCAGSLAQADDLECLCRRCEIAAHLLPRFSPEEHSRLRAFITEPSAAQLEQRLNSLLFECARRKSRSEQQAKADTDYAGRIRCLIDEVYFNPLLDVRMIAEQVGLSQSYVCKVFKKKYGMGISQYINQVRIEHAKELIRSGDQNLKVIALQVGFSGDVQFIRVFKKYELMTPGKYREDSLADARPSGN